MRIRHDDGIIEIKSLYIGAFKDNLRIECYKKYNKRTEDDCLEFWIDKSCFKNGVGDFKAFTDIVNCDLLEKGFFDFDQDYLKLNLHNRSGHLHNGRGPLQNEKQSA